MFNLFLWENNCVLFCSCGFVNFNVWFIVGCFCEFGNFFWVGWGIKYMIWGDEGCGGL